MQNNTVLASVVGIFMKDLLAADVEKKLHEECYSPYFEESSLPLLESADDEDENFFKKHLQRRTPAKNIEKSPRVSLVSIHSTCSKRQLSEPTAAKQARVELNLLNRFKPAAFESNLHMRKMTFLRIFQALRNILPREAFSSVMTPQNAFSLSLWKLTTDEHFEQISNTFHIPLPDCHATIKQFLHLVSGNYESFIEWPKTAQTQEHTISGFRVHPQFRRLSNMFGVIAIKHLNIFLESLDAEVSAVLQIVCNVDQRIIDCYVELGQNYSFENSQLGQTLAFGQQTIPCGSYLLGDITFPLKSYLVRPFGNVCSKKERNFNALLFPAIQLGEQALNSLTQRFNTLYALEAKNLHEVRKIVKTVCALHNLCVDMEDDFVERAISEGKHNCSKSQAAERLNLGESNVDGLRRRYELLDAIVGVAS